LAFACEVVNEKLRKSVHIYVTAKTSVALFGHGIEQLLHVQKVTKYCSKSFIPVVLKGFSRMLLKVLAPETHSAWFRGRNWGGSEEQKKEEGGDIWGEAGEEGQSKQGERSTLQKPAKNPACVKVVCNRPLNGIRLRWRACPKLKSICFI